MTGSLWDLSVRELLARTASADPTPGGGSVAAVSAALGLGLAVMALEVSRKRADAAPEVAALSDLLAAQLPGLEAAADADVAAFETYMAALRLPKASDEDKAVRRAALARAAEGATRSPLEAGRRIVTALAGCLEAARGSHASVVSDAGAGAALLGGALRATLLNVDVNLGAVKDAALKAEFVAERDRLLAEGARLESEILHLTRERLA
ncbi:formiminotetrahydrofolate cyclodeaminase [Deinobacterium chartae]|uniref:Formiminotetrahydrofolate cyclodeaminase n=1 Tax=Deinobacterium chartae TaxID=521158 RepID=A0A841HV22_9DEIO|nr:cyclodeaminase/cyclohydrolase family protein [Deinobacterium chartae]MBB6096673.1 formiminotetrahydrofolate cyclodeaminase [Deinobacterium chartae]